MCKQCRSGYILNANSNVCFEKCIAPCQECSLTDPTTCTKCITGYKLNGNKCLGDISCNEKLNCVTCPTGYILLAKRCEKCAALANCLDCQPDNPAACATCQTGYFVLNSACEPCANNCERCFAASICQKCKDGFMLSRADEDASFCVACAANCKTCIESVTNC